MTAGASPRIHPYGDGETMLGFGPSTGPQLLVLQPLFEEMNRTRALIVAICRGLSMRGIGCWLPDLPGTGESIRPLDGLGWRDWRDAVIVAAAAAGVPIGGTVSFRGGALLDDTIDAPRWRLAPTGGRSLLSDLRRSALATGSDPTAPAGYVLSAALTGPLGLAEVAADRARTLRLASDERAADLRVEGIPVWRRPEPQQDARLATSLIDDIAAWSIR